MKLTRNKIRKLYKQQKQSVKIHKHHSRNYSSKYKSNSNPHIIQKKQKQNTFSKNKHHDKSYKVYLTDAESTHKRVQTHNHNNNKLSHILNRTLKTYIKPTHLKNIINKNKNKKAYRIKYNRHNNRVRHNIQHGGAEQDEPVSIPGDVVLFSGDKPEQQIVIDNNPETDQRNVIENLLNEIGPHLFQIKDSQLITIEPGNDSVFKLSQILIGKYGQSETLLDYSTSSQIKYAASDLIPVSTHFVIDTETPVTVTGVGNTVEGSTQPFITVTDINGKSIEASQKHLYKGTISKETVNDLKGITLSGYRLRIRRVNKASGEIQQTVQYILNLQPGNVVLVVKTAKTMFSELKKMLDDYSSGYKDKCMKIITDILEALQKKGNSEINKQIKNLLEMQGGIGQFKTLVDDTGDTDMNNKFQELMALIEGSEEAEPCRLQVGSKNPHLASVVVNFLEGQDGTVVKKPELLEGNMSDLFEKLKTPNKEVIEAPPQNTPEILKGTVPPLYNTNAPPLNEPLPISPPPAASYSTAPTQAIVSDQPLSTIQQPPVQVLRPNGGSRIKKTKTRKTRKQKRRIIMKLD